MTLKHIATLIFLLSASHPALATPVPVKLEPITHAEASLVIVSPDGTETTYSPAGLEEFATYSMTTATPWRDTPARFEGILLSDLLAAHGLSDVASVLVTAENDYTTTLANELLDSVEILVATRVEGRAHSRRERGPIQFVIDQQAFQASDLTAESNLVWMAARIEAER